MESRPKLPEIPLDMIKQILSWLPVESLLRFKCVHKEWHSLIQDPGFIKLHTDRAWRGTPVLLPYIRDTDDDSFYLVDYHAGLVVEMSAATGRYQIRNPATRQVVDLPDPHPITLSMVAAFDWRSRECKLLARYSVGEEDSIEYKWEILRVGTDEHWRALNWGEEEDVQVVTQYIWRTTCGIHFVDRIQYGNHRPHWDVKVVSVDICRETFQVNALPQRFRSVSSRGIFSIMWDDCQSLADVRDEELHIFVLKKYEDNYRWSDTKIIFPWRFLQEIGYNFNDCRIIYGRADDMWLQFNDNVEICCDVETGRIKEQILPKEVNQNGCYYQPSLVALRGMRPEDSQR